MAGGLVTAVVVAVALSLVIAAVRLARDDSVRQEYVVTVRAVRWWMLPAAVGHIAVILAVATLLLMAVPPLRVGWWMLLGGHGNIALGQTGRDGPWWHLIAMVIPLLVLVLIPYLAHQEELTFRYGSEDDSWWERLRVQMVFGLGHSLVMGVPIAAGVAIIGSGIFYQYVYLAAWSRLHARADLVAIPPSAPRVDYPSAPEGWYDPRAWEAHQEKVRRVGEQNAQLLEDWLEERAEMDVQRED